MFAESITQLVADSLLASRRVGAWVPSYTNDHLVEVMSLSKEADNVEREDVCDVVGLGAALLLPADDVEPFIVNVRGA